MKKPFFQYVDDVIDGKAIVGKRVKQAVERFLTDYDKKDYNFDYEAGERIVKFSGLCHHWKGAYAGKPIELLPHQEFYFINLFGWKNTEDGTRRFRRSYKEIARKGAKTTESAIKSLYMSSKDGEEGAQIYAAATKEDQAKIVIHDAGMIIAKSPALKGKFRIFKSGDKTRKIVYGPTNSFIQPIGQDSNTSDGFDPHCGIIDEYHAHPTDGLVNVLQSGMGMRTQPLLDIITTAGFNRQGPCYGFRKVCLDVLDKIKQDETLFTLIFNLDSDEEWDDEACWEKANPNMSDPYLREKIILPFLRQRVKEAKNEGSSKEVDVKTKNFNIWCDAPEVWIPKDVWVKNNHGFNPEDLKGKICYGGLDLASGLDLNAFTLLFPNIPGVQDFKGITPFLSYFWIPEETITNNRIKMDYSDWVKDGYIFKTPGNVIDPSFIANFIVKETTKYRLEVLGFDARLAYTGPVPMMLDKGLDCQPFGQGIMNISEPTKELERMIHKGEMETFNNPVMLWMNSNVTLRKDSNANYAIDKGKSQGKIDGMASLIDAIGVWQRFPPKTSVYAKRGVMTI